MGCSPLKALSSFLEETEVKRLKQTVASVPRAEAARGPDASRRDSIGGLVEDRRTQRTH
jgi:hypothetical protein